MKLLITVPFLLAVALAARLDSTYLPPHSARTAGGSGNFLSTPVHSGSSFSSFSRPSSFSSGPANSYIPPASGPVVSAYSSAGGYGSSSSYTGGYGGSSSYSGGSAYSSGHPQIRILKLDAQNDGDGRYQYQYETENQIHAQESGEVRNVGGTEPAVAVHGSYSYVAPDGQHITVNYVADENGFRPEGAHIPTPPPIPEEIRRSLEVNAAACGFGGCQDEGGYTSGGGQYGGASVGSQYLPPSSQHSSGGGYRY